MSVITILFTELKTKKIEPPPPPSEPIKGQ
jgi:hypothetical protein